MSRKSAVEFDYQLVHYSAAGVRVALSRNMIFEHLFEVVVH
jgi:hypothetical protein